jgi:hypothetical protein
MTPQGGEIAAMRKWNTTDLEAAPLGGRRIEGREAQRAVKDSMIPPIRCFAGSNERLTH